MVTSERRMTDKEYIVGEDSYSYEMRRYEELEELIRCKDCKYCMAVQIGYTNVLYSCDIIDKMRLATDYCSMAKRKEE